MPEFELLREQLFACLEAGAVATGASVEIVGTEPVYEPLRQDEGLGQAWNDAMTVLGRPLRGSLGVPAASTDMGNVSRRVPALHPFVGITGAGGALHTREFAAHADSPEGYRLMDDCALAMASVIRDVATSAVSRAAVLARAQE